MAEDFTTLAHPAIELGVLLRDFQLGLVLIAGVSSETDTSPVQWVHSSDLADPTPFLTPRTVLLTTGTQFSDDLERAEADTYVRRLIAAGTTALGVAIGVRWDRIPQPLVAACDTLHLPLVRVPYDTPFIAVVRTAARLLDGAQHASEQWDSDRDRPHTGWSRHDRLAASERATRRAVLRLLREGRRDLAEDIAGGVLPQLPRGEVVAIVFDDPVPAQFLSEITPLVTGRAGALSARSEGRTTIVCEQEQLRALRQALTRHGVAAGISERGPLRDLDALLGQAERATRLAQLQETTGPLDYRPAMHAGVLQLLLESPEAVRRAQGLLAPLRRHDRRHDDHLESSLSTWLAHHGQTSPAAAVLGVHRHTLRSRVHTAASLLQRDLDDPDTRTELWAALRIAPQEPDELA